MGWQDRFKVVPAVYLIIRREGKVLLMRRFNTGYQDGNYNLPAGHLDGGEPAKLALAREAKEEVGIIVDQSVLRLRHVMHRVAEEGSHERIDFFFEADMWQGEPRICEPHKCDELIWARLDHLPDNLTPIVRQAFEAIEAGEVYSENGFK